MTSTQRTTPAPPERSILMDLMAVTPSATLGRELLALVLNLVLVGILIVVIQPEPLVIGIMLAVVGLFMLVRLAVGFRTRGYARALTGGH